MGRANRYYQRALERLKVEVRAAFPDLKLHVWIDEGGERGDQLAVSGKDVPLEVYKLLERVLTDRRHPYVDFGWGSDDEDKHVIHRFGEGRTEWFDYYRTADQQIEIERGMDDAYAQLKRMQKGVSKCLKTIFPCAVIVKKDSDKRTVEIAVFVKREDALRMTSTEKEMFQQVHKVIGGYLYGDGCNDFDLNTDIGEHRDKLVFVSTATLCGRGPFSNPLFQAVERERKAFGAIRRNKKAVAKDEEK